MYSGLKGERVCLRTYKVGVDGTAIGSYCTITLGNFYFIIARTMNNRSSFMFNYIS